MSLKEASRTSLSAEVGDDLENTVTILEGEYGKWFDREEVHEEPKLIEEDKTVLQEFFTSVQKQKAF